MGGFISFIWVGELAADTCLDAGSGGGGPGVEAPLAARPPLQAPGTRVPSSRPGGRRVRAGRAEGKAGRRAPGFSGSPAAALLSGAAVGPRTLLRRRSGRGGPAG